MTYLTKQKFIFGRHFEKKHFLIVLFDDGCFGCIHIRCKFRNSYGPAEKYSKMNGSKYPPPPCAQTKNRRHLSPYLRNDLGVNTQYSAFKVVEDKHSMAVDELRHTMNRTISVPTHQRHKCAPFISATENYTIL